jgi:hypothetical protein
MWLIIIQVEAEGLADVLSFIDVLKQNFTCLRKAFDIETSVLFVLLGNGCVILGGS